MIRVFADGLRLWSSWRAERQSSSGTASKGRMRMTMRVSVVLSVVMGTMMLSSGVAMAEFGIKSFSFSATSQEGEPFTQAGGHPYAVTTVIDFNTTTAKAGNPVPDQNVKDVSVTLPAGFVGDPSAASQCTYAQLDNFGNESGSSCSPAAQVGTLTLEADFPFVGAVDTFPVYNMVPRENAPAQFAANVLLAEAVINFSVRTGGDYGLTATLTDIPNGLPIRSSTLTLWGAPASTAHDTERYPCLNPFFGSFGSTCPSGFPEKPLLTMPTACLGPLTTTLQADSWQEPGDWKTASVVSQDKSGNPTGMTGCDKLDFSPTMTIRPDTTVANAPSGLTVDLQVPQSDAYGGLTSATLKDATVTLPAGVAVNPSEANGLAACSPEQIGITNADAPTCPDASKIGAVEIDTPLLPDALKGSVFLAQQEANPFGSLLAIYLTAKADGVLIKLAGDVVADPTTGQLTTSFSDNPQMPFSDLKIHFFGGPHAALMTPAECGTYSSTSTLTPWSGTAAVTLSSPFKIDSGCVGAFAPSFNAGTVSNQAGGFDPFVMSIAREDGEQQIRQLTFTMPPGLSAKLAGVPECSDADAAAGTCPEASRIGSVTAASGAGADPYFLNGSVYLTGPYNGGPFGEVVVVPANAGPFHLGNVVVRGSIRIDPYTAQATVISDPLPQLVGSTGIPTEIRQVDVNLNRPEFMFNPTNCEEMRVIGALSSASGASSAVSQRFQAADCANLAFKPVFKVSTSGTTSRADGASLKVKLEPPAEGPQSSPDGSSEEANLREVKVTLPKWLPARLSTLQKSCTAAQFEADPTGCPQESDVGSAIVHTPILKEPLVGPVYLVSHGGAAFPDVELVLQSEGITIIADGKTHIKKGITTSDFQTIPDAPFSSMEVNLPEGPYSVFASPNGSPCGQRLEMPTRMVGQNGAVIEDTTQMAVSGCAPALYLMSKKVTARTVHLKVLVPAAGTLEATGKGLVSQSKKPSKEEVVSLAVRLTKARSRNLAKGKKVKTSIDLAFTPSGTPGKLTRAGAKLTKKLDVSFKPARSRSRTRFTL